MGIVRETLEQGRQALHLNRREFQPTLNLRNQCMYEEAEAFSVHMRNYQRATRKYALQMLEFLRSYPDVSKGNLPRVWETVEDAGLVEPVRPTVSHEHPVLIGGEFEEEAMRQLCDSFSEKVEVTILKPIDSWCDNLLVVKERMSRVEKFRLELDARRRRIEPKLLRAQKRLEHNPDNPETESEGEGDEAQRQRAREDISRITLHDQRKLEAIQQSYREAELVVWEQLAGLVRDAAWLKSYVASSFLLIKETMQATVVALGPTKQPPPGFRTRVRVPYGAVGRNDELAAEMPPGVEPGPIRVTRAVPGVRSLMHPKRATAQPLQSASNPELKMTQLPPVMRGMAEVPVTALGQDRTPEEAPLTGGGYAGSPAFIPSPPGLSNLTAAAAGSKPGAGGGLASSLAGQAAAGAGGGTGMLAGNGKGLAASGLGGLGKTGGLTGSGLGGGGLMGAGLGGVGLSERMKGSMPSTPRRQDSQTSY